jgi:hypothetical protein
MTHIESIASIQQHSVKDIALTRPILASHCDHMDAVAVHFAQHLQRPLGKIGISVEDTSTFIGIECYQLHCFQWQLLTHSNLTYKDRKNTTN